MEINPFKPPAARLDPDLGASPLPAAKWIARLLGACCVVLGVVRMLGIASFGVRSGLGAATIYVLCLIPILSTFAGVLVFMRSRHAMAANIAVTAVNLLAAPWLAHLVRVWMHVWDSPFDYGQALFASLHPPDPRWLFDAAVIGFCMWDYRRRFAAWRIESSARERPPVESA